MSFGLLTDSAYYVLVIDNPNSLENFYFEYFRKTAQRILKSCQIIITHTTSKEQTHQLQMNNNSYNF
jgi:hypothetical protein